MKFETTKHILKKIVITNSLWATGTIPAPPWGFFATMIFWTTRVISTTKKKFAQIYEHKNVLWPLLYRVVPENALFWILPWKVFVKNQKIVKYVLFDMYLHRESFKIIKNCITVFYVENFKKIYIICFTLLRFHFQN